MSYLRVNTLKIQLEVTLRYPSACAPWEAIWPSPLWVRTCYTELYSREASLSLTRRAVGHNGGSHKAWLPFLFLLFPLATSDHEALLHAAAQVFLPPDLSVLQERFMLPDCMQWS